MRVLVVKTSSLGDIIHTFPALSDAKRSYPEITFDWVVEESFQEVPLWHPAVKRVIPVALRRWRKKIWDKNTFVEIRNFIKNLRQEHYELILDAQGLLKSAFLTLLTRGTNRFGLSWKSARESMASWFYQNQAVVPWDQHAAIRTRSLFAQGLHYEDPKELPDYGIPKAREFSPLAPSYYVFLHGTTWETKQWPERYWRELATIIVQAGYQIRLLWSNEEELTRSQRIAANLQAVKVEPSKLGLTAIRELLAKAKGIITVDTGLGHVAAALGIPTVSLYGPTNPNHSGLLGNNQVKLKAHFPCAPCKQRICRYKKDKQVLYPPCFETLPPALVWEQLNQQVEKVI